MRIRHPLSPGDRSPSVDRSLGMLMSLSAVVLVVAEFTRATSQVGSFSLWWNGLGAAMVVVVLTSAVVGGRAPEAVLQTMWGAVVVLVIVLETTVFLAYRGPDPDALFPWVWRFESVAVCYLVLLTAPPLAVIFPLVAAFLPALSGIVFLGRVPDLIAAQTPLHLGNVVFVVLFLAMRSRLLALSRAENAARAEEARRALLDARARREEQLARVVHDELLSVFSVALHLTGPTPDVVRTEAGRTLRRLRGTLVAPDDGTMITGLDAQSRIAATLREILPEATLTGDGDASLVPRRATETVCAAVAEAARNVARHAPGCAVEASVRAVHGALSVSLTDTGPGFVLERIPLERLGVRSSVIGRMRDLPGGDARIDSTPAGTTVVVEWHP